MSASRRAPREGRAGLVVSVALALWRSDSRTCGRSGRATREPAVRTRAGVIADFTGDLHVDRLARPFAGLELAEMYLQGLDLRRANLSDANLSEANMEDANLAQALLASANLNGAILVDADLTGADLNHVAPCLIVITGGKAA